MLAQSELDEVTRDKEVWGSLLTLLPPQPDLGYAGSDALKQMKGNQLLRTP